MDSNCHVEKKRTCRRDLVHLGFVVLKRGSRACTTTFALCALSRRCSLSLCVSFFLSFFLSNTISSTTTTTRFDWWWVPRGTAVCVRAYFTRRRRRTVLTSRTGGPLDTRLRLSSLPRRRRRRMGQMRRPTTRLQRRRRPGGRRRCSTPDTTRRSRRAEICSIRSNSWLGGIRFYPLGISR